MRNKFDESTHAMLSEYHNFIKAYTDIGLEIWEFRLNRYENNTEDISANLFYRQILEMSDAISELVNTGCAKACYPLLRSLLECYFQFSFLIKENEQRRSYQFLYHYHIQKRKYFKKLLNDDEDGSFFKKFANDKHLKGTKLNFDDRKTFLRNLDIVNENLNAPDYNEIAVEYERINCGKRKVKNWYELFDGPKNIEELAISLNESALYEIIYRDLSSFIHGLDIVHANLQFVEDFSARLLPLRDIRDVRMIVTDTILLIERSSLIFINKKLNNNSELLTKLKPLVEKIYKVQSRVKLCVIYYNKRE